MPPASGTENSLKIGATVGVIGIIIGVLTFTGLVLTFADIVIELAAGSLVMTIFLIALASLVLGMGVPVTAAYLITAVVAVPALTHLGVNEIAAHMIVYWLSQDSNITPPVCIAAFAGATIAKANMWRTAFAAFKFAKFLYLGPFLFRLRAGFLPERQRHGHRQGLCFDHNWYLALFLYSERHLDQAAYRAVQESPGRLIDSRKRAFAQRPNKDPRRNRRGFLRSGGQRNRYFRKLRQGNVFFGDHQVPLCQTPILMQNYFFQIKGALQSAEILFVQALNARNHAGVDGYGQRSGRFSILSSADEMASRTISPCTR